MADWSMDAEKKKKAKKELEDWGAALMLGLATAMVDNLPGLILEGEEWGGGGASDAELVKEMAGVLKSQGKYADGFLSDINDRIDEVLDGTYKDQAGLMESLEDMFTWAKSRAESYAVGAGIPAWRESAAAAMKRNGIKGGFWICTFGPGSCEECQDLHGEYMTLAEFEAKWGNTTCNGGCNCGFMPSNDPEELSDADLEEVDSTVGDDADQEAA